MDGMPGDALEILSVELLERHRDVVEEMRGLSRGLVVGLGWHYLLDLAWIVERVGAVDGRRILDAGAGVGVLQWYLGRHGAEVLSVDRGDRARLPLHFRRRFDVRGARHADLGPAWRAAASPRTLLKSAAGALRGGLARERGGKVVLYRADLSRLRDVSDASVDAVVSVSALEHNPPDVLPRVVEELLRVLKPGGRLIATLSAARDRDWFHEPSQGWCYTEATLRRAFGIGPDVASNYEAFDALFASLRASRALREGLSWSYARSGRNGMPWRRWDPKYQPVGVCRMKAG